MQRLHVVGFTPDNQGLILSVRRGTRTGSFTVDVDAAFEEALTDLMRERGADAAPRIPRAESQLSVREMQQRLRSGQSIRQVARAAGVDDEWVARFAVPIQAEQGQVVRQAFDFVMSKQRLGASNQALGTSVWWNLQDKGVQLDAEEWDSGWSAALLRDSRWVVKLEYEARKRKQVAEWEVDLKLGTVSSRNRLGSDLGYVESGRRRRPGPPPPTGGALLTRAAPPVKEPPAPAPVVEVGEVVAPAPRKRAAARKKAPARKAPAKKAAAKRAPAKKTAAKKGAVAKKAVKRAPAKKKAAKRPAKKKPAPARVATPSAPPPVRIAVPSASPRPTAPTPIIAASRALTALDDPSPAPRPSVTPPPQAGNKKRRGLFRR